MHPSIYSELGADHRRQLLLSAETNRQAGAVTPARKVRQSWVTVVVAAPYHAAAISVPVSVASHGNALEVEPSLLPTPWGRAEPEAVKVAATWRNRAGKTGQADVEVQAAGPTWSHLTVHLVTRRGSLAGLDSVAWSLAAAMRADIEQRLPRFEVPFIALVAPPAQRHGLAAHVALAR